MGEQLNQTDEKKKRKNQRKKACFYEQKEKNEFNSVWSYGRCVYVYIFVAGCVVVIVI